jgi:hypothetical protein
MYCSVPCDSAREFTCSSHIVRRQRERGFEILPTEESRVSNTPIPCSRCTSGSSPFGLDILHVKNRNCRQEQRFRFDMLRRRWAGRHHSAALSKAVRDLEPALDEAASRLEASSVLEWRGFIRSEIRFDSFFCLL